VAAGTGRPAIAAARRSRPPWRPTFASLRADAQSIGPDKFDAVGLLDALWHGMELLSDDPPQRPEWLNVEGMKQWRAAWMTDEQPETSFRKALAKAVRWLESKASGTAGNSSATAGCCSKPDGPKQWGRVFGFSADTFIRRCKAGKIRHIKHTSKSYSVHIDDLPATARPQASGQ
jgi:hypothetical protein